MLKHILILFLIVINSAQSKGYHFYDVQNVSRDDVLNIRKEKNYKSQKIGKLPSHAECVVEIKRESDWSYVLFGQYMGWVKNTYLKKNHGANCQANDFETGYYLYQNTRCVDLFYRSWKENYYVVEKGHVLRVNKNDIVPDINKKCSAPTKTKNLHYFPSDHRHRIMSLAANKPRAMLASLDQNFFLVLRKIANKEIIYSNRLNEKCYDLSWSSSGDILICKGNDRLYLYDFTSKEPFLQMSDLPAKWYPPYKDPSFQGLFYFNIDKDVVFVAGEINIPDEENQSIHIGRNIYHDDVLIYEDTSAGLHDWTFKFARYNNLLFFADRVSMEPIKEFSLSKQQITWKSDSKDSQNTNTGGGLPFIGQFDNKIILSSDTELEDELYFISLSDLTIQKDSLKKHPQIREFISKAGERGSISSDDGIRISFDGEILSFINTKDELLAEATMFDDDSYIFTTPEGFFKASKNLTKTSISIFRFGEKSDKKFNLKQLYEHFSRPDLVIAKLNGDPNGEVARAAKTLNLDTLVASGLPPTVLFAQNTVSKTHKGNLQVSATLTDNGGGIGKLEWRVNGVVRQLQQRGLAPMQEKKSAQSATAELSLDPGKNVIELVAYNKAGLIASNPATMQITYQPKGVQGKPSLYVLAVGVNQYADSRLNLNFAEPDARAIEQAFSQGGKGLFKNVHTKLVLNKQVNKAQLEKAFASITKTMKPEDVFLFFIAGHGKTEDGRYYFIPHDFTYDSNASYKTNGIGQDQWQAWFAKIPAQKSVLLYDTCESGSMTKAGERGLASIERDTSFEKLRKATGRTILSATNDDAPALEGYGGHGIFTYSILEGMSNADSNGDKKIDLPEMITHITQRVPEISESVFGMEQTPRIQSNGNSFVLTKIVQVLDAKSVQRYPKRATHTVQGGSKIYSQPDKNASVKLTVQQGVLYTVFVIKENGDWAEIAKDGKSVGYVQRNKIIPLQ